MDPSATLERLREAYGQDDWDEITAASEDMLEWIRKGGGLPDMTVRQLSALLIMALGYGRNFKVQKPLE